MSLSPTHHKGNVSQLKIVTKLTEMEQFTFLPVGDGCRYDLVLEYKERLYRVQCKTGRIVKDVIIYATASVSSSKTKNFTKSYTGQADLFAIYCPATSSVYMTPVDTAPKGFGSLRVKPPKNNQSKHVVYAKDYELIDIESLDKIIKMLP